MKDPWTSPLVYDFVSKYTDRDDVVDLISSGTVGVTRAAISVS